MSNPVPVALSAAFGEFSNGTAPATDENSAVGGDEMIEEEGGVKRLDMLLSRGFTKQDLDYLKAGKIYCIEQLLSVPKKDLCSVKGIDEQKADRLRKEAFDICKGSTSPTTASVVHQQRSGRLTIHTGSTSLDRALGGGIETGVITEIYGESRAGKSQLCHQLCVTCQLPTGSGGAGARAVYIDTEGTFRPERLTAIGQRYGMTPERVLSNVCCATALSSDRLIELVSKLPSIISKSRFGLVVMDSATAMFRADYSGRGALTERQQKLGKMMQALARIANDFRVAVVVTNQVMEKANSSMDLKAIGGNVMAHASHTRLAFRTGRGAERVCTVVKSPCLAGRNAQFSILPHGIDEVQGATAADRGECSDID